MSRWKDKSGRWHVGIMRDGKRVHRTMPQGATENEAKLLEAQLTNAMAVKKSPSIPGDPPLSSILASYAEHATQNLRSPKTAIFHAVRLAPWCENRKASEAVAAVEHFRRDCTGVYAIATINKSIGTLKTALRIAWMRGEIPENYGEKINRQAENNERHIYLNPSDVKLLARNASEQVAAAIWIALLTGCRRGEILSMTKADIGKDAITIQSGNTKTLRQRSVPITDALRPYLHYIPLKINAEGLKTGFDRARKKAGMSHVTFHTLRHSCASILINMGVPLEVVSKILGHRDTRTTQRYAHLSLSTQATALEKLSAAVGAITPTITPSKKTE